MARRKVIAMDFDGVINSYKSGWKGETVIPDPPVEGVKEFIDSLREDGMAVEVFSSRAKTQAGKEAIERYLEKNDIVVDGVSDRKPAAFVTIDDRAICFKGTFDGLKDQINSFKPWNKQ